MLVHFVKVCPVSF